ncbi:MAG: DNA-binding domain-containing protein [Proteobacteria bacterium]|nr:DNA-binding domain-containing protein [Pseudomonadota bacterium]
MRLNKVQTKFKETVLGSVHNVKNSDENFLSLFEDNHISVIDRLKVYHNNVVGSLSDALHMTFPLIEKLVGKDFFKAMSSEFIFDNPPKGASLYQYGAGFDHFIKEYEAAKSLPYLPDMAIFEWAMNTAYYAPDDTPLAGDALSHIPPENLGETLLRLRVSATLMQSRFPILQIRDFCLDEDGTEKPDMNANHHTKLLITRPALEVNILPLEQDEFMILELLDRNKCLGTAVEQTMEAFPEFDFSTENPSIFLEK